MPVARHRKQLWAELRRRKVISTAVTYMVAAAGVMGAADAFGDALHLPDRALTIIAAVLIVGLPITLVLAWIFDIRATSSSSETPPPQPAPLTLPPNVLPSPAALIGRDDDLDEAVRLLSRPDCRLLTITGPAGIGKTHLAQAVARRLSATQQHGAWFVSLAGVTGTDAVVSAVADALGLPLTRAENALRQLTGFVQEKELLIVLDNFEHLLEGAPLLGELLATAPGVRLLVTSQRRLRIAGETVLRLDALSLPESGEDLERAGAARLFMQVALRSDPRLRLDDADRAAVVRICQLMGGLPLALELAAASVGMLSLQELAHGLERQHDLLSARRDLPPRHQSLRAAFDSSWRLLDPDEQRAFRRVCALRSPFDAEAALAVAGSPLALLARLVDASLVKRVSSSTFDILPVLREFGRAMLAEDAAELADVRDRHTHFFLARLERLADSISTASAFEQLARSGADLRAAWLRAAAGHDARQLRPAAPGLYLLLEQRGRTAEGADLFTRAADALRDHADPATAAARASMMARAAAFHTDLGDLARASDLLEEAIPLLRAEGNQAEVAFALLRYCIVQRVRGDYDAPEYEEALALYREVGDPRGIAAALNTLGGVRHARGRYDEARALYRESIEVYRRIGLEAEAWPAINNLAGICLVEKDLVGARRILADEADAFRRRDNRRALSYLLGNLGLIAFLDGDFDAAVRALEESIRLSREMGYRRQLGYSLNTLGRVSLARAELENAEAFFRNALMVATDAGEAALIPEVVSGVALTRLQRDQRESAATMLYAVARHPTSDNETRTTALELLAELRTDDGVTPAETLERIVTSLLAR